MRIKRQIASLILCKSILFSVVKIPGLNIVWRTIMTAFILVARSPALELAQNSNLDGVCSDVTKANGKKNRLQKSVRKDANSVCEFWVKFTTIWTLLTFLFFLKYKACFLLKQQPILEVNLNFFQQTFRTSLYESYGKMTIPGTRVSYILEAIVT